MPSRPAALALALAALLLAPGLALAKTWQVGPNREHKALSAVAPQLAEGDRVVLDPGEYFDCAFITTNNVTIEGVGPADKVVLTDRTCGGKAILVISGNEVTIRNLTLTRARVPDGNGAGIRDESPHLTVERVRFVNNQNGILTGGNSSRGTLIVRDSLFDRNGTCEQACAHGLYANRLALLRVERSTFTNTRIAHNIKSRALRTEVIDNTITDGPEGTSSYAVDISNGGDVLIRGNTIQKGPKTDNRKSAIMLGAEGVRNPTNEIIIEGNRFRNDGDFDTVLVWNRTETPAQLRRNRLEGRATELRVGPEPPKDPAAPKP